MQGLCDDWTLFMNYEELREQSLRMSKEEIHRYAHGVGICADDVAQDACLRLLIHEGKSHVEISNRGGYLRKIVRHRVIDLAKDAGRVVTVEHLELVANEETEEVSPQELKETLWAKLSRRERTVAGLMFEFDDVTADLQRFIIETVLNLSRTNVNSVMSRIKSKGSTLRDENIVPGRKTNTWFQFGLRTALPDLPDMEAIEKEFANSDESFADMQSLATLCRTPVEYFDGLEKKVLFDGWLRLREIVEDQQPGGFLRLSVDRVITLMFLVFIASDELEDRLKAHLALDRTQIALDCQMMRGRHLAPQLPLWFADCGFALKHMKSERDIFFEFRCRWTFSVILINGFIEDVPLKIACDGRVLSSMEMFGLLQDQVCILRTCLQYAEHHGFGVKFCEEWRPAIEIIWESMPDTILNYGLSDFELGSPQGTEDQYIDHAAEISEAWSHGLSLADYRALDDLDYTL